MSGPEKDEKIRYVLVNATGQVGMTGIQRQYDILFTETGIAFAVVASGLKMASKIGLIEGLGAAGALLSGAMTNDKLRNSFRGLTVKQILELNEKNFFVPYLDVTRAVVKKGMLGGGKTDLVLPGGKFQCVFSKDQLEAVLTAVSEKLGAQMAI